MPTNDPTRTPESARPTDEPTRTNDDAATALSRRSVMRTTAGAGALAAGVGGLAGTGAAAEGNIDPEDFQRLRVDEETNRIVTADGDPFVVRGLTIPDPKRLHRTRSIRGKTARQLLDLVTDNERGWYPRVIRVPACPEDIGEHPMGHAGPEYGEDDGLVEHIESPDAIVDDRRAERPPQPVAFSDDELRDYLDEYYDPIVRRCEERGVYCVVDYHRRWHEQPPGAEEPAYAENHLPYDSEYTNYWAYNDYEDDAVSFGTDTPASWGHVDGTYVEEGTSASGTHVVESAEDIPGTPYAAEHWNVNEPLREEAIAFWEEAAERYGEMEHVLFEPYSTPTAPGIWGPVQGCGAVKQRPLWDVYLDDFVGPILDAIRERAPETLVIASTPGWATSVQALHWRTFRDAGYENVAVSWQNDPVRDVSQLRNWFNDTDYQHYAEVEAETDGELTDPSVLPKEELGEGETEDCWGWERYESGGLQDAMEHHPIVVTEFGWEEQRTPHWDISYPYPRTTYEYGQPILEGLEQDDRLGWIAAHADVRWGPRLFEFLDGPQMGDLVEDGVLVDDNFYDTPSEDLVTVCEDLPCEWELLDDEYSGEYLKGRLEEFADDTVPFETTPTTTPVYAPCEEFDGFEACDPADDGLYRDLTGDGEVSVADVSEFQSRLFEDGIQENPQAFDFSESGDGSVSHGDVIALFRDVTGI